MVGEGAMEITSMTDNTIKYDIAFVKPWKAQNKVLFEFDRKRQTVQWSMRGSVPFYLFFLKGIMKFFIGKDYERGLLMLQELCEKEAFHSDLSLYEEVSERGFVAYGYQGSKLNRRHWRFHGRKLQKIRSK